MTELIDVIEGRKQWTVINADSLATLTELPSQCVDALISDPPYSSGGAFRGDRMGSTGSKYVGSDVRLVRADFHGDNRDQRSFSYWCALWLSEALRASRPSAPCALCIDWRQLPSLSDAIQAGGWIWRGVAVWDKTEGVRPQLGRFRQQAEFVVWGSNGPMPLRADVGALPGVFRFNRDEESKIHQTGKPVGLMMELVRVCPPGGIVLDPFCGSGSTGVAALRQGRRFIGIEMSTEWHRVACERLEAEERQLSHTAAKSGQCSIFDLETR